MFYKKIKTWQSVDYQGFRVPQAGLQMAIDCQLLVFNILFLTPH